VKSESKTALETDRRTLRISLIVEKQFDTVLKMCVVMLKLRKFKNRRSTGFQGRSIIISNQICRKLWYMKPQILYWWYKVAGAILSIHNPCASDTLISFFARYLFVIYLLIQW